MRIYAVADIHGKKFYIDQIKQSIQNYQPDILVIAGDISNYFSGHKTLELLKDIGIPIYGIRGNTDFRSIESQLEKQSNSILLTQNPVFTGPLAFLGTNGTLPLPFVSKICLFEQKRMDSICIPDHAPMVLVTHPPPRGIRDRVGQKFCAGSFVLKKWIIDHQPIMVLCGHIHEQPGFEYLKNTLVINCAMNKTCGGAIIDLNENDFANRTDYDKSISDKTDRDKKWRLTVKMLKH